MKRTAHISYADSRDSSRLVTRVQRQRNPIEVGISVVNEIDQHEACYTLTAYVNGSIELQLNGRTVWPYEEWVADSEPVTHECHAATPGVGYAGPEWGAPIDPETDDLRNLVCVECEDRVATHRSGIRVPVCDDCDPGWTER